MFENQNCVVFKVVNSKILVGVDESTKISTLWKLVDWNNKFKLNILKWQLGKLSRFKLYFTLKRIRKMNFDLES